MKIIYKCPNLVHCITNKLNIKLVPLTMVKKDDLLICPTTKLWIGMSKEAEEKHLSQFRNAESKKVKSFKCD